MLEAVIVVNDKKIVIPLSNKYLERSCDETTLETFEKYREYLEEILSVNESGKISVDWKKREEIVEKKSDYRQRKSIREYISAVLLVMGILTEKREGSWVFSDSILDLYWGMPDARYNSYSMNKVFFVNKENIIEYARNSRRCRSHSMWTVDQIAEVIPKNNICW